ANSPFLNIPVSFGNVQSSSQATRKKPNRQPSRSSLPEAKFSTCFPPEACQSCRPLGNHCAARQHLNTMSRPCHGINQVELPAGWTGWAGNGERTFPSPPAQHRLGSGRHSCQRLSYFTFTKGAGPDTRSQSESELDDELAE